MQTSSQPRSIRILFWSLAVFVAALILPTAYAAGGSAAVGVASRPADTQVFTEQSIYIPYEKLREVFEKQGRGVFLPYEEFEKLWRAARAGTKPPPEVGPPVDALITEASHDAVVTKDVVRVTASLKIELLKKGWREVPLHLATSAITGATIGGKPARIIFQPEAGYKLLLDKAEDGSETVDVKLEYVQAYSKAPGQNSVRFMCPQAPVSRWTIRIPEPGIKVNIEPLIAATEVPGGGSGTATQPSETVVLAFVGAASSVRLDWTPKAEGATGLEALVSVTGEQQILIEEGVTRSRAALTYEISRAELSQLVIAVPAEQKIVNVLDANVRQWTVKDADGKQHITVQLFEAARASQRVMVELEHFRGEADRSEVGIAVVEAVGVGRQQGIVVVQVASGLRAETTRHTGVLQIDAGELPSALAKTPWSFAYRYGAVPFDLRIQIEKIQPRITTDSLVEVLLEPDKLSIEVFAVYAIEQAGVFQLEMTVPADFEIRHVAGREAPGIAPVQVDTHDRQGDDKTRLVMNLSRKAMGRAGLGVRLERVLTEPDLLAPTGKPAALAIPLPRVAGKAIERSIGRMIIHAPEGLRVNPGATEGLRPASFGEAVQGMGTPSEKRFAGARPVLAFIFGQEPAALTLLAERRKPQVTARQLLTASVDSGVVKYEAAFFYDILYSGVKSLRIDLPADLAPDVRNNSPGIRDKVIEPPPKDLREHHVAWSFTGETEFLGAVAIRLTWERKIDKLDLGKSVEVAVPQLRPAEVDRHWGQIVLIKAESIDVQETGEPTGVRPIDPQHDLMPGASVPNAARAFEFHDDWRLRIQVTRYKLEEVKRTSIERALIQMVVTRGGQTTVQALYRIRSAHQRLAVVLPGGVEFDSEPLRINGRRVPLERGDKDEFFVPLVGLNPEQPFLLELRYRIAGAGRRLSPPAFPSEPAVQKVYLCVFLPPEWTYLGSTGPWTDEMDWTWRPVFDRQPSASCTNTQLVSWVDEGVSTAAGPVDTFQTDGRMYLFSSLCPAAPPAGALHLITMDEDWLAFRVLAIVLVPGVVLLWTRASVRWTACGVFVVLLIAIGIFFPTLSRQIVDGKLVAAVVIVLTIWCLHYFIRVRPYDPVLIARRQAREQMKLARLGMQAAAAGAGAGVSPAAPGPNAGSPSETNAANKEVREGDSSHA